MSGIQREMAPRVRPGRLHSLTWALVVLSTFACAGALTIGLQYGGALDMPAGSAMLQNADVSIRDIDSPWLMEPGQPADVSDRVASHTSDWKIKGYSWGGENWVDVRNGVQYLRCSGTELLLGYRIELQRSERNRPREGVTRVMVERDSDEPLYGVLALYSIHSRADPIAKRRYNISIPEEYFGHARRVGLAVVYGTYGVPADMRTNICRVGNSVQPVSWILWLSDSPLWSSQ